MTEFTFAVNSSAGGPALQATNDSPFTRTPLPSRALSSSDSSRITGDFERDLASDFYTHQWNNLAAFHQWLEDVQRHDVVEWTRFRTNRSMGGKAYHEQVTFKCSRGKVRGEKDYEKKHPERQRKIPAKADGCPAELVIRTYPNTATVLGYYFEEHSHPTGTDNARFTRISLDTRLRIAELLRNGVDPDRILKELHEQALDSSAVRDEFVTRADIRRIQMAIEAETIRLDKDDGISSALWVQRWLAGGDVLSFKPCNKAPPEGSGLRSDSFHMIIQTDWQRQRFAELGGRFAGIDGTHNTTCYENTTLFTVLARDKWGHGVPIAWMLSSDGTQESIEWFLRTLRTKNPSVLPKRFMTDRDQAQINAIRAVYPDSEIFYCWWHVLHAWQQHFSTHAYPALWELLKTWIRITDNQKFAERWEQVQSAAPASFLDYLREYWMSETQQKMWSAVHRVGRHVFEESDTNMLIEAWHHVLKGKFLHGKRNRRLDTLICILHDDVLRHYALRQRRQIHGFEGPDLEAKERLAIADRARSIPKEDIKYIGGFAYTVDSQSSDTQYDVDIDAMSCSCYSHPRIGYCKHVAAVELHFPQPAQEQLVVPSAPLPLPDRPSRLPTTPADNPVEVPANNTHHVPTIAQLELKMRRFLARASVASQPIEPEILHALDRTLDDVLSRTGDCGVLPKTVAIPPNIKTATETARVLPRAKTKRKASTLRDKEPYSGGERSGKKARPDALHAPQPAAPQATVPQSLTAAIAAHPSEKENVDPATTAGLLPASSAPAASKTAPARSTMTVSPASTSARPIARHPGNGIQAAQAAYNHPQPHAMYFVPSGPLAAAPGSYPPPPRAVFPPSPIPLMNINGQLFPAAFAAPQPPHRLQQPIAQYQYHYQFMLPPPQVGQPQFMPPPPPPRAG